MKYQFVTDHAAEYPIHRLCKALEVSRSGYYAWKNRPESHHSREDGELTQAIEACYQQSRETYGSPRVHVCLQRQGHRCSRKRVARLMRQQGWYARQHRKHAQTTRQHPDHQKAANVLGQDFEASGSRM